MGQYDAVVICEAPDDEIAAKLAVAIGSLGSIRTETVRAFTEDEYRNKTFTPHVTSTILIVRGKISRLNKNPNAYSGCSK